MSATADPDLSAEAYFRVIEDTFIALRGAPLLLSPADWQTARGWYEEGVPVDLVRRVMEEVFTRLRERDPERRINGLRYCAPAVESAWKEVRELGATEGRLRPEPVDVAARLEELARRLPEDLPGRAELASRLIGLRGGAEEVEQKLTDLEERLLAEAADGLDAAAREELATRVGQALDRFRSRVPSEELPELERRMMREMVRQRLGLPALSLFVAG